MLIFLFLFWQMRFEQPQHDVEDTLDPLISSLLLSNHITSPPSPSPFRAGNVREGALVLGDRLPMEMRPGTEKGRPLPRDRPGPRWRKFLGQS